MYSTPYNELELMENLRKYVRSKSMSMLQLETPYSLLKIES